MELKTNRYAFKMDYYLDDGRQSGQFGPTHAIGVLFPKIM